jgi:hypothetical protein
MKNIFPALLLLAIFSSCNTYLIPATAGQNAMYKPKPMVCDSVKAKTYINGSISGSGGTNSATITTGFLNINRGHTYKNINFSYGAFGYLGTAERQTETFNQQINADRYLGKFEKNLGGVGFAGSVGWHLTSKNGNTDVRVFNIEGALNKEFGDYSKFRDQLFGDTSYKNLYVSNLKNLYTIGVSTEVIFRSAKNSNFQHAFKIFIGNDLNYGESFDQHLKSNSFSSRNAGIGGGYFQFTYFLKYENFNVSTQLNLFSAGNLSLGYAF